MLGRPLKWNLHLSAETEIAVGSECCKERNSGVEHTLRGEDSQTQRISSDGEDLGREQRPRCTWDQCIWVIERDGWQSQFNVHY